MTIYTSVQTEKKPDKDILVPEVVTEPLTGGKEDGEGDEIAVGIKVVRVNYFQASRRSFCIHVLLTVMVLVILACGAIGALVFYRHLNKKVYSGVCGNVYFDTIYHAKSEAMSESVHMAAEFRDTTQMDYFEEGIEVSEVDLFEQLYTPQFDEVQENYVWHDFSRNYTAIIDHHIRHCYVMKLNRTAIAPPKDLIDLVDKLMSGYYMPKAKVIRENYRMIRPPLSNLEHLGKRINTKCSHYETFWLEKFQNRVMKRSVSYLPLLATNGPLIHTHCMLSNFADHQEIFKIFIHDTEMESSAELGNHTETARNPELGYQ
ncbi:unnamed protein product [Candidula unifasciata]|uniref:Integral membrane protein 2 n=1 Tax=Candidula unifasciata TaxID=100452 RepID=A0A8S3YGT4_9EUPU|nr:unnamed protein product [Candidula unifasciata]